MPNLDGLEHDSLEDGGAAVGKPQKRQPHRKEPALREVRRTVRGKVLGEKRIPWNHPENPAVWSGDVSDLTE